MASAVALQSVSRVAIVVGLAAACGRADAPLVDSTERSMAVPVPSSGVAARPGSAAPSLDSFKLPPEDPSTIRMLTKAGVGRFLADKNGRALYAFSGDADGQTGCLTHCAAVWRPVRAAETPRVDGAGIDAAKFAVMTRPDGVSQLTYNRIPLYYYEPDAQPGATLGHSAMGFGGRFSLVSPDGKPLSDLR